MTPCLWFDREAADAVNFYVSVFADSPIPRVSRYAARAKTGTASRPGR